MALWLQFNSFAPPAGVIVKIAPKFIQQPSDQSAGLFQPINFTCLVAGVPTPAITWYKDGKVIVGQGLQYLYIGEMQLSDRGFYMCTAVNIVGEITSDVVIGRIDGEVYPRMFVWFYIMHTGSLCTSAAYYRSYSIHCKPHSRIEFSEFFFQHYSTSEGYCGIC